MIEPCNAPGYQQVCRGCAPAAQAPAVGALLKIFYAVLVAFVATSMVIVVDRYEPN